MSSGYCGAGSGELLWLSEPIRLARSCWFPGGRRLWRKEVAKLQVRHRDFLPQQGPELAGLNTEWSCWHTLAEAWPSKGIPLGRFTAQQQVPMNLLLSRAIPPSTLFHPDFVLSLPVTHASYSCPGRLILSKHWLQSK